MSRAPGPAAGQAGCLFGIGTGPGDPELMTLKAVRILSECPVVAYFCKAGSSGNARRIAEAHITARHIELPLVYPITIELPHDSADYQDQIEGFFDDCAAELADHLGGGRSVAVLNEGDPFFYGSFMHVFLRLKDRFATQVVPGVPSMMASAALLPTPLTMRDDVLTVVPGTMPAEDLRAALEGVDAAVIMKVGRNLPKIVDVLASLSMEARAWYVEKVGTAAERLMPLSEAPIDRAPYFSMVVVPGRGKRR